MTEFDPSSTADDTAKRASVMAVVALAWIICAPFDLYARLREGAEGDGLRDEAGADWSAEGSFQNHNGGR